MARTKTTARKHPPGRAPPILTGLGLHNKPLAQAARKGVPPKLRKFGQKRKFRPGTVALREIRKYQHGRESLLPLAPFSRLVREILHGEQRMVARIQSSALHALREAAEAYMVQNLEEANLCAIHAKRVTIQPKDLHLAMRIRGQ